MDVMYFQGKKIGGQELIGVLDGWIVTSNTEVSQDLWSPIFIYFLFFILFFIF
jgi:hypothetical protein